MKLGDEKNYALSLLRAHTSPKSKSVTSFGFKSFLVFVFREWENFLQCTYLPDVSVEAEVNSFITHWIDDDDHDIGKSQQLLYRLLFFFGGGGSVVVANHFFFFGF